MTRDEMKKTCQDVLEKLRYYGHVETAKQPLLIAAALLALQHPEDNLPAGVELEPKGKPLTTVVYDTVHDYLTGYTNLPEDDVATMMSQFGFLTTQPRLNQYHEPLGDTLLGWVVTRVCESLYPYMTGDTDTGFDVLGYVYAQTMTGDGLGLGIVLTPEHVTTLITDVLKVTPDDVMLDPTAGTGSFLLAAEATAQHELSLSGATHKPLEGRFQGIELQDKLFTLATTNMLLRHNNVSHIRHGSIFEVTPEKAPTVVLLNPPYGLAKNKTMRHLSELAFIERAIELAAAGGRVAALVPQSTMIGKTKDDRECKHRILAGHTLEMVITVNPNAFMGSGYSPHTVVAVFTAHQPHPVGKKVRFINFEDDGWVTSKHVGLVDDGSVTQKRQYLQDVLDNVVEAGTEFMVCSEVAGEDEWHHPYFYFNDTPPSENDFLGVVADYVSWQVDMFTHGLGHLITPAEEEGNHTVGDGE
jgi:hypothetical protein